MAVPSSSIHTGWFHDRENSRLEYYYMGTKVGHMTATTFVLASGVTATLTTNGLVVPGNLDVTTTGNISVTTGDLHVTAENIYMGAETAFATTEPTSTIIFKTGTAPVGAIVTSGAIFTNGTVMRKIIAAGTASNIET